MRRAARRHRGTGFYGHSPARCIRSLCISGLGILTSASFAQTTDRIWSLYTGDSFTDRSAIRLSQPGSKTNLRFHGVRWHSAPHELAPYYGIRYMEFPKRKPWLGFAIEWNHFKAIANLDGTVRVTGVREGQPVNRDERLGDTFGRFECTNGVSHLTLNVVVRTTGHVGSSPRIRFGGYAGIGAGPVIVHPIISVGGGGARGYRYGGFNWQAFAGIEYRMNPATSVFLEGKLTDRSYDFDLDSGEASARFRTTHLALGLNWRK